MSKYTLEDEIRAAPALDRFGILARAIQAQKEGPLSLAEETDMLELEALAGTEEKAVTLAAKIQRVLGKNVVIKPLPSKGRMIRRVHWKEYLEALEALAQGRE